MLAAVPVIERGGRWVGRQIRRAFGGVTPVAELEGDVLTVHAALLTESTAETLGGCLSVADIGPPTREEADPASLRWLLSPRSRCPGARKQAEPAQDQAGP